ncbi:MAG: type II secretion system ATPase GspE [Bdellovibrionota bacterium]
MSTDLTESSPQRRASSPTDNRNVEAPKSDVEGLKKLATSLGLEFRASLGEIEPPRDLALGDFSRIIGSWGKSFRIIPLEANPDHIVIAVSDPLQTEAIDALRVCYDRPVRLVVAPEEEIMRAINGVRSTLMTDRTSTLDAVEKERAGEISSSLKIDVTDAEDDDAPIIRYVNTLIFRAASERASDIHIEPFEDVLKVRFRVDGVLKDVDEEAKYFQPAILSRVKVMADLNIAEKRLPQDGRIGIKIAGEDVDIRVSTVPTRYGERIVMRLLDKSKVMLDLGTLGLAPAISGVVKKIIRKSHGIILVTGPTGSGKTTTLYAWLSSINSQDKNILTVEDPIEYELHGIGQMQVSPKIDFTFATGLRSILRQDPDVIMVGEIRDLETAEIAIQASLTGHLVFSTLHTNDAPGAITRLLDMGVEPFLISSSLIAAMAQRLVRRLCSHCKVPQPLFPEECRELGLDPNEAAAGTVFAAKDGGCKMCQFTGYRGRCGIHEMLLIDDDVRSKIMQRADASQIRSASSELRSLRYDGAQKVLQGITSVEEVLRVTQEDALF